MDYNDFHGDKISRLGFGMMRLPMHEDGSIDYEKGQEMVDYALENGINYIDTAYRYHEGESENFVGEALSKYPRKSYYLADKMPCWLCSAPDDVRAIFEDQLKKCKTDYFDFYLIHSLGEGDLTAVENLQVVEYLSAEKTVGRIRHLGASFHCKPDFLEEVLTKYADALEFVQLQLNYMDWDYYGAKDLYETARKFGKPIIVMEPLRGGMLASPHSQTARDILDAASDCGYPSYGLRFISEKDGILVTLSGMSDLSQLQHNIEIFNGPSMNPAEAKALNEAVKALQADILIPCTACNYCYECPQEIKIPEIFKTYNEAASKGFHDIWSSLSEEYNKIQPSGRDCIGCGNCESHCPQKINIIEKLKEIDAKYKELAEIGE